MAISNVTDWDEIEADPDFSSLPQESRAKLFDDWEKKFNRTLLESADLDKVKPEGLNRFAATNAVRRRKLAGEDVRDPNVAVKSWSEQKQAEAKLAQQALKDYADVEDKQFRVRDADSRITAAGLNETYVGEGRAMLDSSKSTAQKNLEAAEAKFTPEVRAQAQAASEALKGKRKIATLNGNIYTDPALVLDKDEFRKQVLDSDAPPEAKVLKLASFQNEKKRYLDEAINTLTKGDPQIPLAESFPKFLESKGFDLDQEMVKQSEGRLEHSPIQKQRELAQEYLTKMQDRGWFRKIGSAISTGVATGMLDIGTQAVGTAAMLTGDEEKSKVAAELSRASGDIGAAQGLEGDMQATGGTFAGGVSRLGTNMAPMLLPGGSVGGIARLAGAGAGAATAAAVGASALTAGAQTAGSQFGEVYDHLRQQGKTHEQAFGVSRNAAVLSGAVTTALTALGGATGVESLLRRGGKDLVKSRLVAALKAVPGGAAAEIAEELPDEYVSQLVSAFAKDPNASPSQVTDEFAANAPDLILQIAALGGVGSGVGRFKETTTDPAKAAQEQEFPAAGAPPDLSQQDRDNFAKGGVPIFDTEGNVTGYTVPRAAEATASTEDIRKAAEEAIKPGVPVEVNGVTIATIPPESDMTPEDVLDFANSPEDMAMLARNGKITLPEVVAPIEGVDPAITDEMNAQFAKGRADGLANETLDELERQKAAQTADISADISETQVAPTVGETAAPEVDISEQPSPNLTPEIDIAVAPRPARKAGRDQPERDSWDEEFGLMRKGGRTHNDDGTPYQPTVLDEVTGKAMAASSGNTFDQNIDSFGVDNGIELRTALSQLLNDGWAWDDTANKMVNPANPTETPSQGLRRIRSKEEPTATATPAAAETLGVTPPPAPTLEAPEGAARNADMLRQAAARAAGTEQGPPIGFINPSVKLGLTPEESSATGAGMKEEIQQTLADLKKGKEALDAEREALPKKPVQNWTPEEKLAVQKYNERLTTFTEREKQLRDTYPIYPGKSKVVEPGDEIEFTTLFGTDRNRVSSVAKDDKGQWSILLADEVRDPTPGAPRWNPFSVIPLEGFGVTPSAAVTAETETPGSTANAVGGSQGVQSEPAEGSIPTVTEDTVSISDIPSTAETEAVGSVYPRVFNGKNMWALQTSEKRGFGDYLFDTKDEAVKAGEIERRNSESRAKSIADLKSRERQEAEKKNTQEEAPRKFARDTGMKGVSAEKAVHVLTQPASRRSQSAGKTYSGTKAEVTSQMVQDGYVPRKRDKEFVLEKGDGDSIFKVTKTEHDFAVWVASQALEPGEESSIRTTPGEESPVISDPQAEWSPIPGQPATANINGQKVVGTVGPSTGKGLVSFQYVWNGKPQKATVRPDRLESPVASLTDPPKYQYTQEQNTRKMGKHFPVALGVHANHDFRKSFASMAEDTSLSRSYRQIAKVLSEMPAFANVDFHVIADGRKTYAGEYSFFDGKAAILVNLRQVGRGKVDALGTILHEALHHVTLAKVLDPQGDFEIEVVGKLDKIRERVAEYAKQQGISEKAIGYEIGTLEEFISALTRPDFQRFLASIPDSFAPDVAVGKYRSVLSEVFRHIAELLFKKPVPKGSTLEQYTTTILALFETPHRTIPLKPLSYLRAQSKPGYRTPADMLAEAAEKNKGERATEKPQGLAGMFKPQAKRPATGELKLLDMPVRNNLADAYREAVRGSSTQMAPLSSVYAQARLLQPGLTPEAFLAQVQEGYDNGTLLLEGAGSQQEAAQAGLALPGTPVGTAVRMMPAPETPKSLVDEETDAAYLAAVEAGDMETAQRMVDEAAKAAGLIESEGFFVPVKGAATQERIGGDTRLYRASDDSYAEDGQSFSEELSTADAYRHNAGFGGPNIYAYDVDTSKSMKVDGMSDLSKKVAKGLPENVKEWMEARGFNAPIDAWRDQGFGYTHDPLHEQWGPRGFNFQEHLRDQGYDWIVFEDEVPAGAITHWLLKEVGLEGVPIKSADPVTRDAAGNVIPLSQRFNPESPSILYAAPIDTTQSNEPDAGTGGGRDSASSAQNGGSSERAAEVSQANGGGDTASVLARLDAGREAAVSAAVAESDWGNYTPEQKTEALNAFIRSVYGAADYSHWEQFRDIGGPVFTRGSGDSASVRGSVAADGKLNLELTYDNTERALPGIAGGISAREMFAFSYDVAQEEIIHAADKVAAFRRWVSAGRPGTFKAFEVAEGLQVLGQLNKARLDLQNTDPAAAQKIKDAMLASWGVYYGKPAAGIDGLFRHLEKGGNAALYLYELRRQLTQLKRKDFTTETGWQKFRRVLEKWLTDAINSLRGVQDVFRSGMAGDLIQRQLADLEAALEGKPLPPVSRGTPKSMAEEPPTIDIGGEAEPADGKGKQLYQKESDQRESDKVLGVMMEDGRFEEGVKMYDKAKRANLGAPPQPSPNTSTPPRFTSPAQFAAAFEAAFLRGDYDYFLEALKQADRHIYVPEMKRYINASKLGDTDAAERLEWFRHAIAGTVPANVKPQTASAPPPAAVGSPTTPPPPTVTPPPKAGASNRPMLTLNTPAMGLIAKMLGTSIRINTLLRRARGRIKLSMADGSEIELSKHLFKDPVQAAKTLAHEIGHLFDFLPASGFTKTLAHKLAPLGDFRKVFGNDLADWFMDGGKKIKPSKITQLIKPELIALSKKWRGDFSPSDKYRGSGKELYADFISAILNDPMWTAKNAPYATLGFLNALEQKPEVEQAYQLLVSLVQGGSLYKALAEADQGRSTNALERLIAKSSALMRAKKTLNDAARGLYRSMFGKWLPTAIRDGGIWKSYWNRLKGIGTSKDYNWAQEEASQFAVRQITRFDNDLANAVGIPLKLAGIDPDYLQRLQTNNRIIHERRRVGKLIEEDPVKARALLRWMVDAGLLGKDVQAEADSAADGDLYALTAKVIGMMHANGDSFERALKAARRKGAPADAEKALYAFDVSGFMLNPKVLTMESAEADNADIEQTLGPDQFAELQRINDGYHDLVKRTMVDAYKLGLFRKSTWDDVIEPNFGAYVPFTPIKYFTGHVKGGLGPARVGTAHDLMAPHVVGTLKMHALIRRMQQQKQALLLLDFFNNTGLSKELEPVEDEDFDRIKAEELTKHSKHTISYVPYWDEGEYKWVKVNGTDAVTLMQNSDPDDLAALYKVLRSNTQMWRLNYTIFSIAFNVANTLRNVATPFVDIGPKAGYKAAKQLLSVFPQMAKWVWARIAGKDPASVVAASIAVEHALHKPGMPVSKELQEFYDRNILQPMPDVAALRMSQEELARSVMGAMSSPEFLLQGVHKASKDMKWYDNTLKQYLHSAVDVMSFIGSVSEAAPKIAAYQALKEKKDSKGKPAFTDAQATYLATLEGIPRPGVAGAHNAALEMVLMFFRVAVQSWRKHLVMATAPQTRAGFLMRHMLFESAKFGLQAMAANGAIDYLIALGAAAAAGGDDDDPEKFKQVDWAEAMDRQSSYKLSHGGIGPLLGWVLPDGSVEPPWGHKSIPADWVPIMPRLPGTELSREADPLAYYVTSKTMAPMIAPVNDDVFWNDFVRSVIPSLNPTFEVASDAMSVLGPTPPRDSYRGREKVEQRLWDEGYIARVMGLGEHHLKSFGIGSNPYDTSLPGVWNVLKQPGVKTLLASDNMVGVRDEQRARHEDELTSSFAQNMVGEKFNTLKKTFNRLKGKTTPRTKQEEREYEILKPVMSKVFYGTEKRDGKYDVLQSYARLKAKGLQDTPGGKLLKAEAEQATKDLEKIADDLQKPLEFIRTHTLP